MFRTKVDVDRHVQDIISKIHNENEKNLRGYSFARFYYQVKEYEIAKRYISNYLSVRDHHAPSHKLLGQIYEALGDKERALQSFKRSLELDSNQKDIALKICELYCHVPVDHETAKYWIDRADRFYPHHETIFRLRENLVSGGGNGEPNNKELEKLLESELAAQPNNLGLRIKLLQLYLDTERVRDAYDHVVKFEMKTPFPTSVEWYSTVVDIFEAYSEIVNQELDSNFYILYLTALDRLVNLNISEPHVLRQGNIQENSADIPTISDAASALLRFDQTLKAASEKDLAHGAWMYFLNHMKGQLYFHFGSLILKRAKKDQSGSKEASKVAAAFFLIGYSFKPSSLLQEAWFSQMDEQQKLFTSFYQLSSVRTSFIGHVILSLCKEDKGKWLQKIKQEVCLPNVRERMYNRLVSCVNKKFDASKSYLLNDSAFLQNSLEFPVLPSLLESDKSCYMMCSRALHHLVWLHLHLEESNGEFTENCLREAFKGLKYSNSSLSKATPESLCLLDVEAFLLATLYTTNMYLDQRTSVSACVEDLSSPPDICDPLCTDDQAAWWRSAHGLVNNTIKERLGEHRQTLQRGLEVIRGIGNHGLELRLVVHLARWFADQASACSSDLDCSRRKINENERLITDRVTSLENRAQFYWSMALGMLDKLDNNQTLRIPKSRLFAAYGKNLSKEEITLLKEEGKLFIACRHMNSNSLEEAVEILEKLSSADAAYYLALSYKKLALQESATSTARTAFLNRAKNAIYLTMDRISGDPNHPLNEDFYIELDSIESELENQMNNANVNNSGDNSEADDLDGSMSYRNNSKNKSRSQRLLSHSTPKPSPKFMASRAKSQHDSSSGGNRTHLEPSPERLDAQIRALTLSQSTLVKTLMEQQRSLLDTNKAIIEELKQNKEIVVELKRQLEELQVSTKKLQQQQKPAERKVSLARSQTVTDEDGYEYDENGILDYYMNDGMDSYRQGSYGLTQQQQRVMTDVARASLGYVPGAALPPGQPPPLAPYNYQYPPPPHGIPPPAVAPLAAQSPSLVGQAPPQPGSLVDPQSYYHVPLSHGLPFSEGQHLPQFRFHVASPAMKPAANSVPPVPQPVPASSSQVTFPAADSQVPLTTVQSPGQWAKNGPVPHAFQIPLPAGKYGQPSAEPAFSSPSFVPPPVGAPQLPQVFGSSVQAATTNSVPSLAPSSSQLKSLLSSPPSIATSATDSVKPFGVIGSGFSPSSAPGGSLTATTLGKPATPEMNRSRQDSEDTDIEREVVGDFKPVIPLPDEVIVHTGEEDEEVLFENRAKLFRFIDHEWKERGIGTVKILKHENSGKVRLLMRRDQVHKICANHYILPAMSLSPMKDSDRAYTWAAQDFADETVKLEQFCIRFKNQDIAASFKRSFEEAVNFVKAGEAKNNAAASSPATVSSSSNKTTSVSRLNEPITVGLAKPGSWTCEVCYVSNDMAKSRCVACETKRPGSCANAANNSTGKMPFARNCGFGDMSGGSSTAIRSLTENTFVFQTPVVSLNETMTKTSSDGSVPKDLSLKSASIANKVESQSTTKVFDSLAFTSSEVISVPSSKHESATRIPVTSSGTAQVKPASLTFSDSASSFSTFDVSQKTSTTQSIGSGKQVSFGGFTFTSTPVVAENKATPLDREIAVSSKSKENQQSSKAEATAAKSSPFSGFSFKTSPLASSFGTSAEKLKNGDVGFGSSRNDSKSEKQDFEYSLFGSSSSVSNLDFSSLTSSSSVFGSKSAEAANSKSFPGAGSPLFVTVTQDGRKVSGETSTNEPTPEEFIPTAEFKPVIPLPPIVDVKTGEEEEEVLFKERAKMFRYDVASKEWKECGIGDMKILHMRKEKKYRVLMRREQVLKVCANHYILPEMKLSPLQSSDRAWVWFAQDFSQGEMRQEKFAVRFKSVDSAKNFFAAFEKCRRELESVAKQESSPSTQVTSASTVPASGTSATSCAGLKASLSDMFKPELGSWECPSCMIRNGKTMKVCQACETPRPGLSKPTEVKASGQSTTPPIAAAAASSTSAQSVFGSFRFSTPPSQTSANESFVFGNKSEASKSFSSGFVFGSNDSAQSPFQKAASASQSSVFGFKPNLSDSPSSTTSVFGGVSFGSGPPQPLSSAPAIKPVSAPPTFVFKTPAVSTTAVATSASTVTKPANVFSFGANTPESSSATDSVEFRFGSPQKYEFNFSGVRPHSPTKCPKSPRSPGTPTDAEEEDEVEPSDADGIYFQPVIPLPPKVEVKTGEEDEVVIFNKRAKLFRFVDKEWKERGIGDIKILFNEVQKKYRLLMRRDQVLKVCLNHAITKDIKLAWKNDKSITWAAVDYSESEPNLEQLAARFKTAELAAEFKEAMESIIGKVESAPPSEEKSTEPREATANCTASNFSFKMQSLSEVGQSPDRDSVKKCLDFTLDGMNSSSEQRPGVDSGNRDVFSFFSPSSQNTQTSPSAFSLSSRVSSSSSAKPFGRTSDFFSNLPSSAAAKSDPDIEIIYEATPTPEDAALAEKLMLPKTFFLYRNKPPCPGCRGCDEEAPLPSPVGRAQEKKVEKEEPTKSDVKKEVENQEPEAPGIFSNTSLSTFSFADLASSATSGFDALKSTSPSTKQAFPGAGAPVFGKIGAAASQSNEDEEGEVAPGPDVHFEPVIPLPELVEVKTGEEEETALFCSRGKLYRYDPAVSQWKERAIGDMKILQHKEKRRFRLLMRREQVLKVACNHVLIPSMELKPMNTSETALCWTAVDYSEGHPESLQLAIRFKLKETLHEFKRVFEECKAILQSQQSNSTRADSPSKVHQKAPEDLGTSTNKAAPIVPESTAANAPPTVIEDLASVAAASESQGNVQVYEPEEEEDDDDDYEDDSDDDEDIMLDQQVQFAIYDETVREFQDAGMGNLQVLYDDRVFGYRIQVTSDAGEILCDHVIAIQTCLRTDNLTATWSAIDISLDPPHRRQFKAIFASKQDLMEFERVFEDGKKCAVQAEIVEKPDIAFVPVPR